LPLVIAGGCGSDLSSLLLHCPPLSYYYYWSPLLLLLLVLYWSPLLVYDRYCC